MSSPSIFHAPPILEGKPHIINGDSYQQNNHGKKRKPVDPPEEGTIVQSNYYDTTNNTHKRQRASPDDLFGTLSLKPPDPPAHSFCKRKKEGNDDDSIGNSSDGDDGRYAKLPRLLTLTLTLKYQEMVTRGYWLSSWLSKMCQKMSICWMGC